MEAYEKDKNKPIQWSFIGEEAWHICQCPPVWSINVVKYRIAPTKTLRPWTKDEVPLGKEVTIGGRRLLINGASTAGILIGDSWYTYECLLQNGKLADVSPCGVEVSQ